MYHLIPCGHIFYPPPNVPYSVRDVNIILYFVLPGGNRCVNAIDTQRTEDRRDNSICVLCVVYFCMCVVCCVYTNLRSKRILDPGFYYAGTACLTVYRCELYGGELLYKVNIYI